ncbi:MAG TPA: ATP-binding cassette domain-containing protein [Candidatus Dormibacteraeota bacterium]|nr:ATP-binding cassette domain-containing protein [Candidatus Dormibacteraeota bacterium]
MATARLRELSYWYPRGATPALDAVELEIGDGLTLVTGPSGGGKSTLLRVLNGLVPHFHGGRISGTATVCGRDIIATPTAQLASTVGFVFQDPELQAVYDTVEREVAFGLENLGVAPRTMHDRVDRALAEIGVEHLRHRRMRTLSGGERQRVALASVLALQPRVLVLDEPASQLDDDGAARVLAAATDFAAAGRAVVIAEHRPEMLSRSATAVLAVDAGRIDGRWEPKDDEIPTQPRTVPGAGAWTLTDVTAGHDRNAVIGDVTLDGRQGEIVVLTGPNGGGKTTLLRTIAGTLKPLAGKVERRPGRVAYLPQNPAAILHRPSVRAEVDLTLQWSGENGDVTAIVESMGLTAVAGRYARDLSSGQRQRAAVAAVLVGRPQLVLLDEPTRGMDARARTALVRVVRALRDGGAAVVLATHDAGLERELADRVVEVCGGRAIETNAVTA